jgi:CoA:oxalate CoA-transferase
MLLEEDALRLPGIASTYQPVETADGFATIAAVTEDQWTNLLVALGREELLADERFATNDARLSNLQAFRDELTAAVPNWTTEALIDRLAEFDVPCGPILTLDEVPDFPQVVANETLIESEHPALGRVREPRPPARFDATPSAIRGPAPTLGEHTDAVLADLGRTTEEIAKLRADGAVS